MVLPRQLGYLQTAHRLRLGYGGKLVHISVVLLG